MRIGDAIEICRPRIVRNNIVEYEWVPATVAEVNSYYFTAVFADFVRKDYPHNSGMVRYQLKKEK